MLGLRPGPLNYLSAPCPVKWLQQIQPAASCALPLEGPRSSAVQPKEHFAHANSPKCSEGVCADQRGPTRSADDVKKINPSAILWKKRFYLHIKFIRVQVRFWISHNYERWMSSEANFVHHFHVKKTHKPIFNKNFLKKSRFIQYTAQTQNITNYFCFISNANILT